MKHSLHGALVWAALAVMIGGCSDTVGGDDGGPDPDGPVTDGPVTGDTTPPPPGLATFKAAGETAEIEAESASDYLVIPYSVSDTEAETISFSITVESGGSPADAGAGDASQFGSKSFGLKWKRPPSMKQLNPRLWARWRSRLAVEAWTRAVREESARKKLAPQGPGKLEKIAQCAAACGAGQVCAPTGSCESSFTLKVEKFAPTAKEITVEVKKVGTKAAILAEQGATVDTADVDKMLDVFENTIHPRDVALFGDPELKQGEPTLASDRNGDGLVWLVITDKVTEVNSEAVGFFVATDFEDVATNAMSNEADILYMVPPEAGKLSAHFTIMAHEYQHLLNYGSKVYKPKVNGGTGGIEALWLDEGQAHFAEDACGYGGENTTLLDQELFTAFEETAMFTSKDSLPMRALAMLFVRYLFEQKGGATYAGDGTITDNGGAAWLQALRTSDKTGTAAVTATYGDYKAAFDNWIATIGLDGRGVTNLPQFGYKALVDDPVTGNQIGIKIRGKRKDATGAEVDLKGPAETEIQVGKTDGTIPNATGQLFLLKGMTGSFTVKVETQEADFRFAVIKASANTGS